jgi:hypothetical protein
VKSKMRAFVIVEGNVPPDGRAVGPEILGNIAESFFLDRAIEPLQMSVVIGSAHTTVTMHSCMLPEELREFGTVIALQHLECEGRGSSGILQECQRASCIDPGCHLRKRPPGMHIEKGVDVEALSGDREDVNGVHLHQIAGGSHIRPVRTAACLLPRTATLQKPVTLERSLHGTQADIDAVFLEEVVNHLAAAAMLLPTSENRRHDIIRKCMWMTMRSGAGSRNIVVTEIHTPADPAHDGRWLIPEMTGDTADTLPLADTLYGLSAEPREVWIGGVWHVRHYEGGCCQAIEPLRSGADWKTLRSRRCRAPQGLESGF